MIAKIKENPIKYVRLFSLIYILTNLITTFIYYLCIGRVALNFATILGLLFSKVPIILFLIHTWKFYGTNKTQVLLPISYIVSIIMSFFSIISSIRNLRYITYYNSFAMAARYGMIDYFLNLLFGTVGLGISIFLLVDCLLKFKRLNVSKKLVVVNAIISLSSMLIGIVVDLLFGYRFALLSIVGIAMSLSVVFSLIAYIIFWVFAIDKANTSPIEISLIELKKMYESGKITVEDYNIKRAELLDKF